MPIPGMEGTAPQGTTTSQNAADQIQNQTSPSSENPPQTAGENFSQNEGGISAPTSNNNQTASVSPLPEPEQLRYGGTVLNRSFTFSSANHTLTVRNTDNSQTVATIDTTNIPNNLLPPPNADHFTNNDNTFTKAVNVLLNFYGEAHLNSKNIRAAHALSGGHPQITFTVNESNVSEVFKVLVKPQDNSIVSFTHKENGAVVYEAKPVNSSRNVEFKISRPGLSTMATIRATVTGGDNPFNANALNVLYKATREFYDGNASSNDNVYVTYHGSLLTPNLIINNYYSVQFGPPDSYTDYTYSPQGVLQEYSVSVARPALNQRYAYLSSTNSIHVKDDQARDRAVFQLDNDTAAKLDADAVNALDKFFAFYPSEDLSGATIRMSGSSRHMGNISYYFNVDQENGDSTFFEFASQDLKHPTILQTRQGKTVQMFFDSGTGSYRAAVSTEGTPEFHIVHGGRYVPMIYLPAKFDVDFVSNSKPFTQALASLIFTAVTTQEQLFQKNAEFKIKKVLNKDEYTLNVAIKTGTRNYEIEFAAAGGQVKTNLVVKKGTAELYKINLIRFDINQDTAALFKIVDDVLKFYGDRKLDSKKIDVDAIAFRDEFFGTPVTNFRVGISNRVVGDVDTGNVGAIARGDYEILTFTRNTEDPNNLPELHTYERLENNASTAFVDLTSANGFTYSRTRNGTSQSTVFNAGTPRSQITKAFVQALFEGDTYFGGLIPEGAVVNIVPETGTGKFLRLDVTAEGQTTKLSFNSAFKLTSVMVTAPNYQREFKIDPASNKVTLKQGTTTLLTATLPSGALITSMLLTALDKTVEFESGKTITIASINMAPNGTLASLKIKYGTRDYDLVFQISGGMPVPQQIVVRKPKAATIALPAVGGNVTVTYANGVTKNVALAPAGTLINRI